MTGNLILSRTPPFLGNFEIFKNYFFAIFSMVTKISGYYVCLAVFRVFSAIFMQNGYIHPDEFFQTTEIITGDIFSVVHERPWEFNKDFPVRSIGLLYGIFGVPLYIAKLVFKFYKIHWNPFTVLLVFRLVTCAISFLTDYSLYKICKIRKIKPDKYLILLASSYVLIVFGTKTFTNSLELALVSLLLWKVIDSMTFSEKILTAENEIRNMYANNNSATDQIRMILKLKQLPSHHYINCLEISNILVVGIFNRPTFLMFAITPLFYWISRGFTKNFNNFVSIFNIRFLLLVLCATPGVFIFILIDSYYFGHITELDYNLVITPLNFIKYNINPSNLAQHGIHFRLTHAIINIPLLFNVLTLLFLGQLHLNSLIKIVMNRHYHLLPNIHGVNTLMAANVIVPLFLFSIFPHQEPRFLLPLLLPFIFTTSKYFSSRLHSVNNIHVRHPLPIWCFCNVIGLIFFGYLHQAGITPMISHLFEDIKFVRNIHIIHSHTYSIPVGLLLVNQLKPNISIMNQRRIKVHDLGSSLDTDVLYETVNNIIQNVTYTEKPKPVIYFALSGSITKQFESIGNFSSHKFTKKIIFPHVSTESFNFYLMFMTDLLYYDKNKLYFDRLLEFRDIFSLVLYKFTKTV